MKTLFALIGLFMFVSVSTTSVNANIASNDQPVLTEDGGAAVGGGRRVLVLF